MSKPKVKIKKILDKDGNVIRTEVDIDNSALVKTVRGKTGAEGMIGPVGATGLQGEPGEHGKDVDPTVVKELKESISFAEEEIQSTKKTLSKLDKKNDKRITGVANINKSIRSDITTLDSNLIGHIDNKDVHFDDKIQKDKVIDHLEQDHTAQIITSGGAPPHDFLQQLSGGKDVPKEFFHLTEEEYSVLGDHSELTNLDQDDHTQYLLLAGRDTQTVEDNVIVTKTITVKRIIAGV